LGDWSARQLGEFMVYLAYVEIERQQQEKQQQPKG